MTQGTPRKRTPKSTVIDLDTLLVARSIDQPQIVRFAGRDWSVRRNLTGEEAIRFWALADAINGTADDPKGIESFALLVGDDDAAALWGAWRTLPVPVGIKVMQRLWAAAGLKRGDEPEDSEGESSAS